MANTGQSASSALQRLSIAKNTAQKHLLQHQRHSDLTAFPPGTNLGHLHQFCLRWGFCQDLAVVSISEVIDDTLAQSSREQPEGSSKSNIGSCVPLLDCQVIFCGVGGLVLDNYGAKVGCLERAIRLVGLLAGTDGMLVPSPLPDRV